MSRNLMYTGKPVLDQMPDTVIANGSAAMIDDMLAIDRNQFALMYKFGSPPWYVSTSASNAEATLEYRVPPGVEFIVVHVFAAGDGGFVTNSSSGANVKKLEGAVTITSDTDTNGTKLNFRTKPNDLTAQYTGIHHAYLLSTEDEYDDDVTAYKYGRRLRVAANPTATAWATETIRLAIPSTVTVYGVGISPVYRTLG